MSDAARTRRHLLARTLRTKGAPCCAQHLTTSDMHQEGVVGAMPLCIKC